MPYVQLERIFLMKSFRKIWNIYGKTVILHSQNAEIGGLTLNVSTV